MTGTHGLVAADPPERHLSPNTIRPEQTMKKLMTAVAMCGFLASVAAVYAADAPATDPLTGLKSDSEQTRLQAIDALGLSGGNVEGAVDALIGQLGSDSAAIRAHAAHALGQIGAKAKPAAEALVGLVGDKDKHVRREAVRALRRIRPGPKVVIPLMNKLLRGADDEVRLHAMDAMAEEGKAVVPPLIEALRNEEACYWACLVLAEIGPDAKEAVPALTTCLKSHKHPDVCREAILALAAIGPEAASAVPALIKVVKGDEINAPPAVYALGSIGPKAKSAEVVLKKLALANDTKPLLRTVSLWALAMINPDDKQLVAVVVPRLVKALQSEEPRVRAAAARALVDLDPDPEILRPLLKKVMETASPEVVDDVLDALASLGERAVPRLIEALKHEQMRSEVAMIIARIGTPAKAAVPALVKSLDDEDPQTRSEVLFALAAIGPDAAASVPAVSKLLDDPEASVRYGACFALGKMGPAAMPAKAAVVKKLSSDDPFLAMAAAWALAQIHPECGETAGKSVPILIKALAEPDVTTRVEAARALECLGPLAKPAVPALSKALGDESEEVRKAAAEALQAIAG